MPDMIPAVLAAKLRPGAMAESRDRWRDFALLAADLVFETDAAGRIVFAEPNRAFGWDTETLIGRPLDSLVGEEGAGIPRHQPLRDRLAWLRHPDGRRRAVSLSTLPIEDGNRLRGALQDRHDIERERRLLADTVGRRQVVRELERRMRRSVLPETMMRLGLDGLLDALGAAGAMVVVAAEDAAPGAVPAPARILHRVGAALPTTDDAELLAAIDGMLVQDGPATLFEFPVLRAATGNHFSRPATLLLWRDPRSAFVEGDAELAAEAAIRFGTVLDQEQVQREFARQSGADILTGLLTRDSFRTEAARRLERLTGDGAPSTVMVLGLDRFGAVNTRFGHEQGDAVLRAAGRRLRDTFRPTDLVARLHGDVFAAWMDGADQFAAAERAETLCQTGLPVSALTGLPPELAAEIGPIALSVGMGICTGRTMDAVDAVLEQANAALHAIKLAGGGRWHVYNEGVTS